MNKHIKRIAALAALPILVVGAVLLVLQPAYGNGQLTERGLQLDNSFPGQSSDYKVFFTINDPNPVGSLKLDFCSNSPLEVDVCNAPNGFDLSSATLVQSNGFIDMSILSTTPNEMVLTRPATPVTTPLTVILTLQGVTNPSAVGTYYGRIATYGSNDASGSRIDYGGLAFAMAQTLDVNTIVPPYLIACAALTIQNYNCDQSNGSYLNFGDASPKHASSGQSELLLATNATNGYAVYVSGNTMTSGNNVIPALASADVSRPGTNQFGINLRANTDPDVGADASTQGPGTGSVMPAYNVPNQYRFVSGDQIATATGVESARLYTVSYLLNITKDQAPGVYSTTMLYTALANF